MKGKASDICPKCKHCEGLDRFRTMYSCKHYNNYPDSAIGIDCDIACYNFEEVNMNKVEGKVSDWCPKCKNCKGVTRESNGVHAWLTEVECEDPYDGMVKTLNADSDICCTLFEVRKEKEPFNLNMPREAIKAIAKLNNIISELEKEKADHLKGIERLKKSQENLQNQVKNLQTTNEESYKREEKLEDKVHRLERRLLDENKRFSRLDSEFLTPLARVLYPREAKICKPYSEVLDDIKRLIDKNETLEQRYDNIHYALYKDWSDDSISCPSDIPSDVEMIEDLKKRAADSDYYKEKSELLEEKLKKDNELADSWKRDYEFVRDQLIHPIYDILYPDNLNRDINVTDLLADVKNLKIYEDENKSMYEDLKYWRERCHGAETDVTTLNSKVETLKNKKDKYLKKITDQQTTHYKQCARILELENIVSKLQSGEYDDILAKDIEIKSLQAKYDEAMAGWKDAIDTNDKQIEEFTRRYNMVAKKLNDIHDILKEESDDE